MSAPDRCNDREQKNGGGDMLHHRFGTFRRPQLWLAAFGFSVASCTPFYDQPTRSTSHFEAARILLSQRSVIPWSEIAPQLAPGFEKVKGDDMYAKVLPITQIGAQQILSSFLAQLELSLPGSTTSIAKTTDLATGAVSGTETETKSSGEIPELGAAPAQPNAKDIPTLLAELGKLKNDPVLSYELAAGLVQRVALLNQELQKLYIDQGKQAFLVGMDLDVQPYKRNQPYDVFVDISFFPYQQIFPPERAEPACMNAELPEVFPLLHMDNLELEAKSNAVQNLTQLNLALSGVISGVGAAANTAYKRDAIRALVGNDRNSLFTLGKSSMNTLAARIGALRQVQVEYEMQAQSHRIYALMVVPKAYLKCGTPALHVVAQSSLTDGKSARRLPMYTDREFLTVVAEKMEYYGVSLRDLSLDDPRIVDMRVAVTSRDFSTFVERLTSIVKFPNTEQWPEAERQEKERLEKERLEREKNGTPAESQPPTIPAMTSDEVEARSIADIVWQDIQNLESSYGLTYEKISLPSSKKDKPNELVPATQTVIARIADASTKVTLVDTQRASSATDYNYSGELRILPGGKTDPDVLLSTSPAQLSEPTHAFVFTFPSLDELGYEKDIKGGAALSFRLLAKPKEPDAPAPTDGAADEKPKLQPWDASYRVRFVHKEWQNNVAPQLAVIKPAKYIVANAGTGKAEIKAYIEMKGLARVEVQVVGADSDSDPQNKLALTFSQAIDLKLGGLTDGATLRINAIGYDDQNNAVATATSGDLTVRAQAQKQP
ncbi:hypothetical protein [Dongia sp.]|uniref:hypothetical protein n=1 Tax=Dongia sp. TaxID=1977262 RepID=UPI0035AF22FE